MAYCELRRDTATQSTPPFASFSAPAFGTILDVLHGVLSANDSTFTLRLILGLTALGVLAAIDLIRHPRNPTRIKEYGFLFTVTGLTMAYGLIHDLVTHSISSEYFTLGKGIAEAEDGFGWPIVRLALMASWSAGLFVGVALLVANNPKTGVPQLSYRELSQMLSMPLWCSAGLAVTGAVAGFVIAPEVAVRLELAHLGLEDPHAFVVVSGIHAGSYLGGLVGAVAAFVVVRRRRKSRR
jgi:hypothetical protein